MTAPVYRYTRQFPQPTTSKKRRALSSASEQRRPSGGTAIQEISFFGVLTNGKQFEEQAFSVLAGEEAPTVAEGYAKWARVPRPQRVAYTTLEGYEPLTLTVPILFNAVTSSLHTGEPAEHLERDMQKLEWMGGRGILFKNVGHPGQGDSPLVQVFSVNAEGRETSLVPKQYQTANLRWLVTGIAWDANPLRGPGARIVRQAATVTLTEHVGAPGSSFDSAKVRSEAREKSEGKFAIFKTTNAINTIRLVASKWANNPTAWPEILAANKGNRKIGNNADKHLPVGTRVKVPLTVRHHV